MLGEVVSYIITGTSKSLTLMLSECKSNIKTSENYVFFYLNKHDQFSGDHEIRDVNVCNIPVL